MTDTTTGKRRTFLERVLDWLRAGYPQGVPRSDYVALLGVLHRKLTDAEVNEIVTRLAADHVEAEHRIAESEIRDLISSTVHEQADEDSIRRVAARLVEAGWPLADAPAED